MGVHANDAAASHAAKESDASVKYRLVEAEEVETEPKPMRLSKGKKKTKMSWSQMSADGSVEDAPRSDDSAFEYRQSAYRGGRGRGGRYGGRGRGSNGRRPHYDENGVFYNGVYMPNPDIRITAQWAKSQIEFYFTPENLVRDVFLRQHMDVEGYVPLAFVGSFQAVYSLHQDYASLLDAVKSSEYLEFDEVNEKIRLRVGWEKWLWPNADGGYGVPLYVKMASDEEGSNEEENRDMGAQ